MREKFFSLVRARRPVRLRHTFNSVRATVCFRRHRDNVSVMLEEGGLFATAVVTQTGSYFGAAPMRFMHESHQWPMLSDRI